ncbi:MAG: SDR family oxidoreductase [Chloroflexota bacterium]|jgi:NAD(P)-dependent dehydrogenase (short-subunit alcohol dehydrogenase family)
MAQFSLEGKVAVISGASRGIGEAIARTFAGAGAKVVIGSRRPENIYAAAKSINAEYPDRATGVVAHAGKPEDAQAMVDTAVKRYGRLDVVVNNAGTNPHFGPILTSEPSQWDKILEVNVKGAFWLCQAGARQMQAQGEGGKIINIASVSGIEPGLMMGIYSVSKAAVIMLTKVLAMELAPDDIQVNAIAPGIIKTRFSRALWDSSGLRSTIESKTPAGRIGQPEEVCGLALYLASGESSFTTGGTFTVDGGYTLT